jgi:hypothetical protein
MLDVEGDST